MRILARVMQIGLTLVMVLPWGARAADAQGLQIVPVVTDQTPLPVSNQFAPTAVSAVNDAGDLAAIGSGSRAVFYRRAGTPAPIRVMQAGDAVPGLANSSALQFLSPILINASGVLAVRVEVGTPSGLTSAVVVFDGTTLTTVVTGFDTAPNTGGAKFERSLALAAMNDSGDLLVSSSLVASGPAQTTLFLIPAGQAPVRVAGFGDAAPGVGGTFTNVTGSRLNNQDQVLIFGSITGGTGGTGYFAWTAGTLRKIVAVGDPNPLGGTFSTIGTALMNNTGLVAFIAGGSAWSNTEAGGTTAVASVGTAVPWFTATFSSSTSFNRVHAVSDADDAVFTMAAQSTVMLFRYRPGEALDLVAVSSMQIPGGGTFSVDFFGASVNAAGTVSFVGSTVSQTPTGIFQKVVGVPAGTFTTIARIGGASPLGGTHLSVPATTRTLADNSVHFRADVLNGSADYAEVLVSSGAPARILLTDQDALPPGGRLLMRGIFLSASGADIAFPVQRAGGRTSVAIARPSVGAATIVATDGEVVAGSGGSLLRLGNLTVVPTRGGRVMFPASLRGGPVTASRSGLVVAGLGLAPSVVAVEGGTDTAGRALTSIAANQTRRPGGVIDPAGGVPFTATASGGAGTGVFVGSVSGPPQKVALPGDMTSTGVAIAAIGANHSSVGINDAGRVLFSATTTSLGLFLAAPGEVPLKVVQVGDAAPGGGTFASFAGTPSFNAGGQVAFMATVTGGAGGGIFLFTPGDPISAIALNGQVTPAGGTFTLSTARLDVLINDQGDVGFIADIAGGPANSGYFIQRGPLAPIEVAALQGQPAPGTAGVFGTFNHTLNSILGEFFQLAPNGDLAMLGSAEIVGQPGRSGSWRFTAAHGLEANVINLSMPPDIGGGTITTFSQMGSWLSGERYAFSAAIQGGSITEGLFLSVRATGAVTATGQNVSVAPVDPVRGGSPVTVTFANVLAPGQTSVTTSTAALALPRAFALGAPSLFYNVTTTAVVNGAITICIDFTGVTFPAGAVLRLLHFENGSWVDVTSSGPTGNVICGIVTSLSPFAVAQALNVPSSNIILNGDFSNGTTSWSTFDGSISFAVNSGVFEYSRPGATAVVLQPTGVPFAAGAPIVARFDVGNTSTERKRFSVLIHNDFAFAATDLDLAVCTFYLPPNTPLRTYAMRTHTTIAWQSATISIYAASGTSGGGVYQLDNVVMGPGHALSTQRTDCVDPDAAAPSDAPDGMHLLTNGDFATNDLTGWNTANIITTQVTNGVAQFIRPSVQANGASGVLFQSTGLPVAANQIVTASFKLGNSSNVRKRITVLLHATAFNDLAACTFWLAPNQPLSTYSMRTWVSQAWASAMISFYPATTDALGWFELDDVTMSVTPGVPTSGSDCVEPGDTSGINGGQAPMSETVLELLPHVRAGDRDAQPLEGRRRARPDGARPAGLRRASPAR